MLIQDTGAIQFLEVAELRPLFSRWLSAEVHIQILKVFYSTCLDWWPLPPFSKLATAESLSCFDSHLPSPPSSDF